MVKRSIFSNPLVIDGSMSTSLERLGCDTDNELWTAAALLNQPELVYQVHKEYFEAGARLAITDTYQANLPALKKAGLTERQEDFHSIAIGASNSHQVLEIIIKIYLTRYICISRRFYRFDTI